MKKHITSIMLLITLFSFGQKSEYKQALQLVEHKNYNEANELFEKLLNKEFGSITKETHFNILISVANSYEQIKNYNACYDKWGQTIAFLRENHIHEDEIEGIAEYMKTIKNKMTQGISSNSEVTKTNNTPSTNAKLQNEVTLTVSGNGKTLEEAKTNALRSAIEQAFGAFISSKTEILNDNLVMDEIVSVANGNIQKYDILSEVELPKIGYAVTLSATVSISKLSSFAESKGVEVEFKGGMFAQNIKLQKLNEQSEEKATKNLVEVYLQLLENSFDYSLVSSEPVLVNGQADLYKINFKIKTIANDNYNNFIKYFKETLDKVQATDDEATNFIKVGKPLFYLIIDKKVYKFRSINSFHYVDKFFISSQLLATSFKVTSNLGIYKYSFKEIFENYRNFYPNNKLVLLNSRTVIRREEYLNGFDLKEFSYGELNYFNYYKDNSNYSKYLASLFSFFIENNTQYKSLSDLYEVQICPILVFPSDLTNDYKSIYQKFISEKNIKYYVDIINIDDTVYFNTNFNQPSYTYEIILKLNELEQINSFKISKIPFLEYINNLSNYVELEK